MKETSKIEAIREAVRGMRKQGASKEEAKCFFASMFQVKNKKGEKQKKDLTRFPL